MKIIVIEKCCECPYIEQPYIGKKKPYECGLEGKKLRMEKVMNTVPKWCPLDDVE